MRLLLFFVYKFLRDGLKKAVVCGIIYLLFSDN